MFYAIIIYPKLNFNKIEKFREKYDPLWPWIKPHITLVFPFDFKGEVQGLENHIETVLSSWGTFKISLQGVEKAWDNFIFLKVSIGKKDLVNLHDQLYTNILKEFLNKDLEYIPHVTMGLGNAENAEQLVKEAENLELNYETEITDVSLSRIDVNSKKIIYEKNFNL